MDKIKNLLLWILFTQILLCILDTFEYTAGEIDTSLKPALELTQKEDPGWWHFVDKINLFSDTVKEFGNSVNKVVKITPTKYFLSDFVNLGRWFDSTTIVLSILAMPVLLKVVIYYLIAPILAENSSNVFSSGIGGRHNGRIKLINSTQKNCSFLLSGGQSLIIKSNRIHGYGNDDKIQKSKALLFNIENPLLSFLAGLIEMDRYTNKSPASISLDIQPSNSFEYFTEVELSDVKEVLISPKSIVAMSPSLKVKVRWILENFPFLGRMRYYYVSGSGTIILSANGGIIQKDTCEKYRIAEKKNIVLADLSLSTKAVISDIPYNYFVQGSELFDLVVNGEGILLMKNDRGLLSFGERLTSSDSLLNVVGRLFGF